MNRNNILLLAVGDGAITIVEQNKAKLSDYFFVTTVRCDAKQHFNEEQWKSVLRLIILKDITCVCVLNCIGGGDYHTIASILKSLSSYSHVLLAGIFVFPFSFEGNTRYSIANQRMSFVEKYIISYEYVVFEDTYSRMVSYSGVKKIYNDDMFQQFPSLPFHVALRQFNENICNEIIAHMNSFMEVVRSVPQYD